MNENRPISAESQHNFHFLPHFNSKTTEPIFTIFLYDVSRAISGAINAHIRKAVSHSVAEWQISVYFRIFLSPNNDIKLFNSQAELN